jgi:hypothetical protein
MQEEVLEYIKNLHFNGFDAVLAIWLLIGVLVGRKRGMSVELLPVMQWLLMVVGAGYSYRVAGIYIKQTVGMLDLYVCYQLAYVLTATVIYLILSKIRSAVGEKLVGSDVFGRNEFYLGMLAGLLRYACIALLVLAVVNAHIIPKDQTDASIRAQRKELGSVYIPPLGQIQRFVLFESLSGRMTREYLSFFLISTPVTHEKTHESIGRREQRSIDEITGATNSPTNDLPSGAPVKAPANK